MGQRIIKLLFFGNYFVGLLAIVLSLETAVQLQIPFSDPPFYLLIFSATVLYYTYAYSGALQSPSNPNLRTFWYAENQNFVSISQKIIVLIFIYTVVTLLVRFGNGIKMLSVWEWLASMAVLLASLLYYGLLPRSFFTLNLRDTGWLKAFVIGFVWAGVVNILPVMMLHAQQVDFRADPVLIAWLFVKNWMFCTVNAIIFDLKDYADDSNRQLKTFAVTFGMKRTISFILFPLIWAGIFFLFPFAWYRHFTAIALAINLLPFFLLMAITFSLHRERSLLYYLVVIDGAVFVKAVCGIAAMMIR